MAQPVFNYTHILTNTTTTIKTGPTLLGGFTINTKGTGGNVATIFDATSTGGAVVGVIDTTSAQGTLLYDLALTTGLVILTAGGVAPDLTVEWA